MYLVFRFITGLGVGKLSPLLLSTAVADFTTGALLALVPLYQSEISPPKIRGFLVGIHGVMLCLDYALAS